MFSHNIEVIASYIQQSLQNLTPTTDRFTNFFLIMQNVDDRPLDHQRSNRSFSIIE